MERLGQREAAGKDASRGRQLGKAQPVWMEPAFHIPYMLSPVVCSVEAAYVCILCLLQRGF